MKRLFSLSLCLAVFGTTALAQAVYTSSEGHSYRATCNTNGYIITSVYPVSRFTSGDASGQIVQQIEVIYLGKSCDAFSKVLGQGQWCWANGGFVADLEGGSVGFPRQELYCQLQTDLGIGCLC